MMIMMMIIFIYRNWVSTQWQLLVSLYKNKKETAVYKRINNTKAQNTQNRKQTYKPENKHKKNIIKHKSSNK
jgi:hypothetical protein